ncbi:unnamed protein product [Vicia faba]|uniref:DUF7745 domain-containing protein n=1 Tax=Vicia faba TaxID=3906 RepID=A0AAV0ZPH3_VICFA|nr:unnamed protein product [Vicia faba]
MDVFYIFFKYLIQTIRELALRVSGDSSFTKKYGRLFNLATSNFQEEMMCVLFQFFDPMHHCFTFPDYQLVSILEDFSQFLGVLVLDQIPFADLEETPKPEVIVEALHLKRSDIITNWETRSGVKGFLAKFLLEKARLFWENVDFQAFEDVLALIIYDLVLFPNPDQLIDVNSIKVFLSRNPVPTLLGDILHCFHTRTMKKRGTLLCCIPLLSRWFIAHLPRSTLKNEQGLTWSQRMMSLAHSDISLVFLILGGHYYHRPLWGIPYCPSAWH